MSTGIKTLCTSLHTEQGHIRVELMLHTSLVYSAFPQLIAGVMLASSMEGRITVVGL